MIEIAQNKEKEGVLVVFTGEGEADLATLPPSVSCLFAGKYLETAFWTKEEELILLVGTGQEALDMVKVKELCAKAVKECLEKELKEPALDVSGLIERRGIDAVRDIVEGAMLGTYRQIGFDDKEVGTCRIRLLGVPTELREQAQVILTESVAVAEGIAFARDMVNLPGNHLRPADFAAKVMDFVKGTSIEAVCYDAEQLRKMGMDALLAVGESSEFPPCMLVLRYHNDPGSKRTIGLIGKGVTCDTGGYCLKAAGSMLGIKGDMAGGAAVVGAVYALAKKQAKSNVVAVIPMCENRISAGSLLPGDVISSYSGKTIEIGNTDAEGRLILADAVSYAIRQEHATKLLDIATLTGAVVNLLGFSIAGVICDDEAWFGEFEEAIRQSGERYLRIPFYAEHEKMIESDIADVRNMSKGGCGTITAGLFIREFAEGLPWLHLDIAGTAWVDEPVFAYQSKGATGAGVTSLFRLCCGE